MVPSAANAATCLPSTFNSGAAKLRHGKATQMSRSFRLYGCWHWLSGRRHQPAGRMVCRLQKPTFNPPNWVFAPTWTVLYVMIAVAGWRTYLQEETTALPMQLWLAQMILNFLWSPIFFTLHHIAFALAIILTLLAVIVGFIWVQWRENRPAAVLFIPYAAWVAFASLLNYSLYRLN